MSHRLVSFFVWLLIGACFPCARAQYVPKPDDIKSDFLYSIVVKLASPGFEGRLPGSTGYNKAAKYTAGLFKKYKVKPVQGNAYFQYFDVEHNEIKAPLKFEKIGQQGKNTIYSPGKDFVCRGFTGQGVHTSEVVFCGYGISLPKFGYDDYEGMDVKNKVVMIFKENPAWKFKVEWPSAIPRYKVSVASQNGAFGVIFVNAPKGARTTQPIGSIATGSVNTHNGETTSMHVSQEVANDILKQGKYTVAELQQLIDSLQKPFSFNTGTKVYTEVHTVYTKEKPTMNVVGVIEGNDPVLKDEYVVIGAHLDHVGKQGDSLYFPGANDNASGVAAVLHMARLFNQHKKQLKRSVVFILFSNEEQGMVGSWHYVNHPLVPTEKTVAMLNLDCIGHGDSIQLGSGESAPLLWQMARDIDKKTFNLTVDRTWAGGGADASPFYDKNIPTLYFVTTNSYTHLHLPSDTPATINKELHRKITYLAYATAWEIATGNYQKEKVIR